MVATCIHAACNSCLRGSMRTHSPNCALFAWATCCLQKSHARSSLRFSPTCHRSLPPPPRPLAAPRATLLDDDSDEENGFFDQYAIDKDDLEEDDAPGAPAALASPGAPPSAGAMTMAASARNSSPGMAAGAAEAVPSSGGDGSAATEPPRSMDIPLLPGGPGSALWPLPTMHSNCTQAPLLSWGFASSMQPCICPCMGTCCLQAIRPHLQCPFHPSRLRSGCACGCQLRHRGACHSAIGTAGQQEQWRRRCRQRRRRRQRHRQQPGRSRPLRARCSRASGRWWRGQRRRCGA